MLDQGSIQNGPIGYCELAKIEATSLSNIERHHLRLLAHCLASFKEMANGSSMGPLPSEAFRKKICFF